MDERKSREEPTQDAELKRPDEEIKDLEPDERQSDAVKGGYIYQKIKIDS